MFMSILVIMLFVMNVLILANRIQKTGIDLMSVMVASISMISIVEFVAGILNIFGCIINSGICVGVYCITAITMMRGLKKKHKIRFIISKYEIIFIAVITVVYVAASVHMFGVNLIWTYRNSDPAVHFMHAMDILREKKLNGMYFASLLNAGVIEFFSYFLNEIHYYKAYILADVCLNYFECIFFFACMYKQIKSKRGHFLLPISYTIFVLGYPMYSYVYGGYNYWGLGTVLCIYVLYWLNRYEKEKENRSWIIPFISLGCFGVSACYMLFAPFVYITTFVILLRTHIIEKDGFKMKEYVFLNLKVFLIPTILTIYYSFFVFFNGKVGGVLEAVNMGNGKIDLFDEFLFLIPLLGIYIIDKFGEKDINTYDVCAIVLFINIALFLGLGFEGIVDSYYFNKLKFPLWCLIWFMLCDLFEDMRKEVLIFYVYAISISMSSICLLEEKTQRTESGFIIKNEIEIYSTNMRTLLYREWGPNFLTKDKMELYTYILDEIDERVVMLSGEDLYKDVYFYEAIIGEQSAQYCWHCEDDEESFKRIEDESVNYIVVLKESNFYERNADKLSGFETILENDTGCIIKIG